MTTNKLVYSMAPSAAALVSSGVNIPTAPAADPPPNLPQAPVLTVGNSALHSRFILELQDRRVDPGSRRTSYHNLEYSNKPCRGRC